jgi:uncharacterized protein YjbI with pentapeptide repeats
VPDDQHPTASRPARTGRALRADCDRCVGLCCVAPAFSASADFAIDKPAGAPCPNLRPDFRCGIHDRLRREGFSGCVVYDCFGAGQRVTQETFGGRDWRSTPAIAQPMFAAFAVMRQLHELLWHLTEALRLPAARPLHDQLRRALDDTDRLALGGPDDLAGLDLAAHRREVNGLLVRASELARVRRDGRRPADRRGADLIGRDLRAADLRGANLRGAYLIGADLRWADLGAADLAGADLRGADLGGADLAGSLFLTQSQLDAATGDAGTRLPPSRTRPAHWRPSASARPRPRRRR